MTCSITVVVGLESPISPVGLMLQPPVEKGSRGKTVARFGDNASLSVAFMRYLISCVLVRSLRKAVILLLIAVDEAVGVGEV